MTSEQHKRLQQLKRLQSLKAGVKPWNQMTENERREALQRLTEQCQ